MAAGAACLGALVACAPSPPPSTATATARPILSPTPSLTVSLQTWHIDATTHHVLGVVTTASGPPSSDVVLEVSLVDAQGEEVGKAAVPLINKHLLPSGLGLFAADFPSAPPGSSLRVHVLAHTPAGEEIAPLEASVWATDWEAGQAAAVLGQVTNPHDDSMRLDDLWIVGRDAVGQPRTVARASAGADVLTPGVRIPFRADALDAIDVVRWEVLAQGSPDEASGSAAVDVESLQLQFDPQGKPFATGWVVNSSDRPRRARLLLLVTAADTWISAGVFEGPVPVPAHTTWPFSIEDLPGVAGWKPQEQDAHLELSPYIVDAASAEEVVELVTEVTGYEVIGSRLYLRGTVQNEGASTVERPALSALIQSADGEMLTAGWTVAAERLGPAQRAPFLLVVPVPEGADLNLAEYVVEAFGTKR